jgi:hypothetical protein
MTVTTFKWTKDMWACVECRAPCIGETDEPLCFECASDEERARRVRAVEERLGLRR